ncbi:MAG TPA: A/G-specific adenine glycosylase [Dehalococcoidia bacterium]|nr:A/G-specific adenine glycosylase [Dehalococcoidia bacterium]
MHPPAARRRIQSALLAWHGEHGMHAPWRDSGDPYHCLVAAVMAQQTQMSRVMPSYGRFIAAFPTAEALAAAPLAEVIRVWKGMGYNARAVRLHRAAKHVVQHGWPREAKDLARIDGIGPFTAAIIASFAFGRPAACADTNVRRVLGRITGDENVSGRALQTLAGAWMHEGEPARWNQALMDYGAAICAARPRCGGCVVSRWCASHGRWTEPGPRLLVADSRVRYAADGAGPRKRPRFEETSRYLRGRIVDVLRAATDGEPVTLAALARRIEVPAETAAAKRRRIGETVAALERDGLLSVRGDAVSLPD